MNPTNKSLPISIQIRDINGIILAVITLIDANGICSIFSKIEDQIFKFILLYFIV